MRPKALPSRHRDTYQNIALCKTSTHQGDPAAFNPNSIGRQCLPNCLIACSIDCCLKNHQVGQ